MVSLWAYLEGGLTKASIGVAIRAKFEINVAGGTPVMPAVMPLAHCD